MTTAAIYWWGVGGSAAIEVLTAYQSWVRRRAFPVRYSDWQFWVVRILLALVAGGLAVASGAVTEIAAAGTGAAAPLILEKLAEGAFGSEGEPSK